MSHPFCRSLNLLLFSAVFLFAGMACSSTKTVQSKFMTEEPSIDGNLNDWPSGSLQPGIIEDFDIAVSNDDEYVYIGVNFRNNRTFRMARDHGFRIYIDSDKTFRRSFGLVYPTGIVHGLGDYPGARQNYLKNPSWENLPDNARIVKEVEENMPERVRVIRRTNPRDRIRPATVSMSQLEANGLKLGMDTSGRFMSIEIQIPIDDGSDEYFTVKPSSSGRFYIDFEIEPMSYEQITGERPGFETVDVADNRDHTGRRTRTRTQLDVSDPRLYNLLNYKFESRVRVTLSD